jgi:metal-responsive CopG/Arc/MetJ family transcriptional regulator
MPQNRFTIFLPDETLKKLDNWCNNFAVGDEAKRSRAIAKLIERFVPDVSNVLPKKT